MRVEQQTALADEDRGPLLDFWIRAWTPIVPSIDFAAQRGWLSDHLDALLREGAFLLMARDPAGRPVGFLTLDPLSGEINQLAVDPDVAGRGLGQALMTEAQRLRPAGLRLRVNTVNERALRFYRRAGFLVTGETVSVRSGLPVLTMAWPGMEPGP